MAVVALVMILTFQSFSPLHADGRSDLVFGADWMLGARFGWHKVVTNRIGWRCDVGLTVLGCLTLDAMTAIDLVPAAESLRVVMYVGMPNACAPVT